MPIMLAATTVRPWTPRPGAAGLVPATPLGPRGENCLRACPRSERRTTIGRSTGAAPPARGIAGANAKAEKAASSSVRLARQTRTLNAAEAGASSPAPRWFPEYSRSSRRST